MEGWQWISGYEGRYRISTYGRVMSMERQIRIGDSTRILPEREMRQYEHVRGYLCVYLRTPDSHKKFFVHRLVAQAFLPNPNNLPLVNHRDLDKKNNNFYNLQWMNGSDNTRHYYRAVQMAEVSDAAF